MPDRDLVFYVQFQVKPDCVQEWKDAVVEVINHMAKENTFVTCYMHQDTQDANRFTLYERWCESSVEAFVQNQLQAKSYRKAYEEKLPNWLELLRETSVLSCVNEWQQIQ
ncbi:MAG: antibiotic biosynthesis monooxygenase [Tildeniella nuda ZEHNDER 1965/U140]|jgi:quinol monooxygenase YgiN|nr:antibiotic biosynthesis monooxygenase [Tildeniella nuda ZEHNDER 1965/U140]